MDASAFDAALQAARARWPEVRFPVEAITEAIARATEDGAASALALLDLCLACACAHGDPAAISHFEREHIARIPQWLKLGERDAATVSEVAQRVRERALAPRPDGPPRIAAYSGRGPLGAWVRVMAIREHANLFRAAEPDRGDDQLADLARSQDLGPELLALRAEHLPAITAAFRDAIAEIEPRARTLLRLCYLDELGLDAIGRMYGVNKSTVSRWLAAARAELLAAARTKVRAALALPAQDVDSLLRAMPRDLELSLHRLLT